MMANMPPEAMAGISPQMVENIPPEVMSSMSPEMMQNMPQKHKMHSVKQDGGLGALDEALKPPPTDGEPSLMGSSADALDPHCLQVKFKVVLVYRVTMLHNWN